MPIGRQLYRPFAEPPLVGGRQLRRSSGVPVESRVPVTRLEANLPYGYETRDAGGRAGGRRHADAGACRGAAWTRIQRPVRAAGVEVINNRDGDDRTAS